MLKWAGEAAITRREGEEEEIPFIPEASEIAEHDKKNTSFLKMKNGKGNRVVFLNLILF